VKAASYKLIKLAAEYNKSLNKINHCTKCAVNTLKASQRLC